MDELFERDTDFAAAPDVFPPDRFNAGVLVLRPSLEVLEHVATVRRLLDYGSRGDITGVPCACNFHTRGEG